MTHFSKNITNFLFLLTFWYLRKVDVPGFYLMFLQVQSCKLEYLYDEDFHNTNIIS